MRFSSPQAFHEWPHKAITLVGMSGVGKTSLANQIPKDTWFHYSVDYRIGTRYLGEAILDEVKRYAMQDPYLAELLRSDSIYIANNLTVDNLKPLATFLGKLGNPAQGGLPLDEFKRRQRLHREAEICALHDVAGFIDKAHSIYGYPHFLNDAGGSLCELDDEATLAWLDRHSLLLYLETDAELEQELIQRAQQYPKPLYYHEDFLDRRLQIYLDELGKTDSAAIDPDEFVRWIFPHLLHHRLPRYRAIAERYGYSVDCRQIEAIRDEQDFIEWIAEAIAQQ